MARILVLMAGMLIACAGQVDARRAAPANWDRFRWGMPSSELADTNRPSGDFRSLLVPAELLRATSPMRSLVEPNSYVLAFGDARDGLREVQFATLLDFRGTVAALKRVYGPQAKGPDNEDECIDAQGNRRADSSRDPVTDVVRVHLCMRQAVFLDRRHGNAILVNAAGSLLDFRPKWHDANGTIVAIKSISCWPDDCEDYRSE